MSDDDWEMISSVDSAEEMFMEQQDNKEDCGEIEHLPDSFTTAQSSSSSEIPAAIKIEVLATN